MYCTLSYTADGMIPQVENEHAQACPNRSWCPNKKLKNAVTGTAYHGIIVTHWTLPGGIPEMQNDAKISMLKTWKVCKNVNRRQIMSSLLYNVLCGM